MLVPKEIDVIADAANSKRSLLHHHKSATALERASALLFYFTHRSFFAGKK